jgi:hypothetical protein
MQDSFKYPAPQVLALAVLRASSVPAASRIIAACKPYTANTAAAPEAFSMPQWSEKSKLDQVQAAVAGIPRCNPPLLAVFLCIFGIF